MMTKWEDADWESSTCDAMHDIKCFTERICKIMAGSGSEGMYKSWGNKDNIHRFYCRLFGYQIDFANGGPPPWRLGKEALRVVDLRILSMWWPHYMDPLSYRDHSFWTHSDRVSKCKHKAYALLVIMPTCLDGFIPEIHTALLMTVSALRHLGGQVYCFDEARRRGFVPGLLVISF